VTPAPAVASGAGELIEQPRRRPRPQIERQPAQPVEPLERGAVAGREENQDAVGEVGLERQRRERHRQRLAAMVGDEPAGGVAVETEQRGEVIGESGVIAGESGALQRRGGGRLQRASRRRRAPPGELIGERRALRSGDDRQTPRRVRMQEKRAAQRRIGAAEHGLRKLRVAARARRKRAQITL
jgi:hypothetical protein